MNLSKGWLDHAVNLLRQASGFALQKVRKSSNFTQYAATPLFPSRLGLLQKLFHICSN